MEQFDYDLFVIGAGSGGVRACRVAANLGAKVAVAEERYFGGTCVNVGCVPKKLFSYAALYKDHIEDAKGFGWSGSQASFDWSILLKNDMICDFSFGDRHEVFFSRPHFFCKMFWV